MLFTYDLFTRLKGVMLNLLIATTQRTNVMAIHKTAAASATSSSSSVVVMVAEGKLMLSLNESRRWTAEQRRRVL